MQQSLGHYIMLARRWAWMVLLGIVICGGATYIATLFITPSYQASSTIIINLNSSSSAFDNLNASELAVPTYAQLLTSPQVLEPVLAQHSGMTLKQLVAMIGVKPQSNTELIELDVTNGNPYLATELANEIGQSFVQFTSSQFSVNVQVLPAIFPKDPVSPKPLLDTGIGALVGLGLAIALILLFEWAEDRVVSMEEMNAILRMDVLTVLPQLSRTQREKEAVALPFLQEAYRIVCARLNLAQQSSPFKLLMVTSAVASEGKTTITANLARFLALSGKKVLLVEADLRLPTLSKHFQLEKRLGFASALLEPWTQLEAKLQGQPSETTGLWVLAAEFPLQNSTDLLQSPQVKTIFEYFQRAPYDYVLFDTPPLLPVADTQLLATLIPTILLVVDAAKSSRKALARAKTMLSQLRVTTLGVVVNKSQWLKQGYGYGYEYGYISQYVSAAEQQADIDTSPTLMMPRIEVPSATPPGQEENVPWHATVEQRQRHR